MFDMARRILIPRPNGPAKRWGQTATQLTGQPVRVSRVIRETPDAVTLVLQTVSGKPIAFKAGQYLTHNFQSGEHHHKRAYSISAAEGQTLACTIKAIPGGAASQFVLNEVQAGYEYTVLGPSGDFVLPADEQAPLAFLAAGSGITPVISLIETALTQHPSRSIRLLYASRNQAGTLFDSRLRALAQHYPQLTITRVLSQPESGWTGERGRLTGERAARMLAPAAGTHVYLCGPVELMQATARALTLPAAQIHQECFLAAPRHTRAVSTQPQPIEFRRSGRSVIQRPGETLLEAGLREGLTLPFSCTVGGCAACKLKVLDGEVTLDEPNCLSTDERAQGYTLSCSSYALCPTVIDA